VVEIGHSLSIYFLLRALPAPTTVAQVTEKRRTLRTKPETAAGVLDSIHLQLQQHFRARLSIPAPADASQPSNFKEELDGDF
jgi:hypothetical protein